MKYLSRLLLTACVRLGYLLKIDQPLEQCNTPKFMLNVFGLSAAIAVWLSIVCFFSIVSYKVLLSTVDSTTNPPDQYFEGGAWVWPGLASSESEFSFPSDDVIGEIFSATPGILTRWIRKGFVPVKTAAHGKAETVP